MSRFANEFARGTAAVPIADAAGRLSIELHPLPLAALAAIRASATPEFPGWQVAEGALPPRHVAERALRLLREGCAVEWALPFNIVVAGQRTVVGGCGFKGGPVHGVVEIGYGIAAAFQRRGIASSAVQCLLQRAAGSAQVREVVAHIVPGNRASEIVAARAGFQAGPLLTDAEGEQVVRWHWQLPG